MCYILKLPNLNTFVKGVKTYDNTIVNYFLLPLSLLFQTPFYRIKPENRTYALKNFFSKGLLL